MRRTVLLALLVAVLIGALAWTTLRSQPQTDDAATPPSKYATEQEWIVSSVVQAIVGMAEGSVPPLVDIGSDQGVEGGVFVTFGAGARRVHLVPTPHVWAPETYAQVAKALFAPPPAGDARSSDLSARTALADLTVDALLDQNARVSARLQEDMQSFAAHESAALIVGALALRESARMFDDVRPALSRMSAHLAIADALRGPIPEGLDGSLARAILTALAGLQRDAVKMVDAVDSRAVSLTDRTWVRALRLRITGDWRKATPGSDALLLERLEYARAIVWRRGIETFLDYLDTLESFEETDWQRIALASNFSVEAGNRFAENNLEWELAEAAHVRSRLVGDSLQGVALVRALNDRPGPSPFERVGGLDVVRVLDWGTWATFAQRHLAYGLAAQGYQLHKLGLQERHADQVMAFDGTYGRLTLYPMVQRAMARTPAEHQNALDGARPLVSAEPEIVTAGLWDLLRERPDFVKAAFVFPLEVDWFTPAVPSGTAFDLDNRALRKDCPRPPTKAQAAQWAYDRPYAHWTLWAEAYRARDAAPPSLAVMKQAFGPLLEYDEMAVRKVVDYMEMSVDERIDLAQRLCEISPASCEKVAYLLLAADRTEDAAVAYEYWIARSRDRVGVSNGVTWIVRYLEQEGEGARAEEIALMANRVWSARGIEALADLFDRRGRYDDAETLYRQIAERYTDDTSPLGAFLVRKARRERNSAGELKAWKQLRPVFPEGLPQPAMQAPPVRPTDGVAPLSVGQRAARIGLERDDIIVGVDGWRVRTVAQYQLVAKLRHEDAMTLTVWRGGRYQEVPLRVPQRWFGVQWRDYDPPVSPAP